MKHFGYVLLAAILFFILQVKATDNMLFDIVLMVCLLGVWEFVAKVYSEKAGDKKMNRVTVSVTLILVYLVYRGFF